MGTEDIDTAGASGEGLALPSRPERILFSIIALVLAADFLLWAVLPAPYQRIPTTIERAFDLRDYLAHVSDAPGEPWLLIGDSVLVGSVIAPQVSDWARHRVVEYMGALKRHSFPQTFHQVALDGLVPADISHIVAELDRLDPAGRVSLLVELNPRFFSSAYAGHAVGSRPWLSPATRWERGRDWIANSIPIVRHRRRLSGFSSVEDLATVNVKADSVESDLAKTARVLAHYRDLDLADDSSQILALSDTVQKLTTAGRQGVFFTTPLNDRFVREVRSFNPGTFAARMSELVDGSNLDPAAKLTTSLVNLDAPVFRPDHFIDHSHLLPEGSRLLAQNLLHELNIGLVDSPDSTRMVNAEDADRSLVARVSQGYSDGAAWQALFDTPRGLAVDSMGRIFVADTRNHCIRALSGNLQTVRTVAGVAGKDGLKDGPPEEAHLSFPTHLVSLGETVYFVDGRERSLLRMLQGRRVVTLASQGWTRIDKLRTRDGKLYLLDEGRRVLEYDPATSSTRVVISRPPGDSRIVSFDVSPEQALYLVDGGGRISSVPVSSSGPEQLLFANSGSVFLPTGDDVYPLRFDQLQLKNVHDLLYVERYHGLLIQDRDPPKHVQYEPSESIHLRFLSLVDERAYPWLKPLTAGNAYITPNVQSESLVSLFHEGAMVLHQETASLFYVESKRSRLYIINDGLWGSARVSHGPWVDMERGARRRDPFGERLGEQVLAAVRPQRFLGRRLERQEREGPFVGAFFGSSFTVTSDISSQYSLARSVEVRLAALFGYRDRIRYQHLSRMRAGLRFSDAVELFESQVVQGVKLDAAMFSLNRRPLVAEHEYPMYLDRLRRAAESYDTKVILLDNGGLGAVYREGLTQTVPETRQLLELATSMGFDVIELSDTLLEEHLRVAPWGSPPYEGNHASPWAIEATAALIAERAYPVLARHFEARTPGYQREDAEPLEPLDPSRYLTRAFRDDDVDWAEQAVGGLPRIQATAIQRRFDGRRMRVYVDLTHAGLGDSVLGEISKERLVLSVLHDLLVLDRAGHTATEAQVTLATFSNYDEYGQGVLDAAVIHYQTTLDREALDAAIGSYLDSRRREPTP